MLALSGVMLGFVLFLGLRKTLASFLYGVTSTDPATLVLVGLSLTAIALAEDPKLEKFAGRVSDSGEGRWTIKASIDEGVPSPVLTESLYERFTSRGQADFADKLLSAMRYEFGGHLEKAAGK